MNSKFRQCVLSFGGIFFVDMNSMLYMRGKEKARCLLVFGKGSGCGCHLLRTREWDFKDVCHPCFYGSSDACQKYMIIPFIFIFK